VRQARLAANLTQQEVAGQMYSKAYISAVERGTMTPSLAALHFLAERLERPLSYFLGEEVREPPSEAPKAHVSDEEQTAQLPKFTPKIQRVTASGEVTSLGARVTV
jgi:transcriptional regulator with XRE-family HTH domain